MKKNNESTMQKILSSPIFFLGVIVVIFGAIIYFSGDTIEKDALISDYEHNPDVVTITEYGDYQCPACGNMYVVLEEILKDYEGKVWLDYRHFPLSIHENAENASMASECAREQGKFWDMHEKLYKNQNNLQLENLGKFAVELELEMDKFNNCMADNKYIDKINKEKSMGELDDLTGTPTFYVNGKKVINSENSRYLPKIDDFRYLIDRELEKREDK
ncbi:DsbA family protein [Patescibacteria group bacterium]|nr:DsbA family protein [Patescibacteria group bacterium]